MMQDVAGARMEITGVNPSQLPTVVVTTNVFDRVGQPIFGLSKDNFSVSGELAGRANIVSVENITDNNLTFSVVLAIDTSSSMAGTPLESAKEAATNFINTIGSNNPSVAIVSFDSTERLVQDFTSDKAVLLNAISNLVFGGKTALYDGGLLAVQTAARSPSSRRAVIILSDGAEFGGRSSALRGDALDEALKRGVPIYTIGLGFGIDRSYLQELAGGTNGQNYESPGPEQLLSIYQGLATTLQSQYVVTLDVNVPADGTVYKLDLESATRDGSATATADLRAPIPLPIVSLPVLPAGAISQPTEITAEVKADDAITAAEFQLNGVSTTFDAPPYTLTIDPVNLPPGNVDLSFSVTDATGDSTSASQTLEIAALPSSVTILGVPQADISEPQTITLDVTGQTPAVSAAYSVDNGDATTVTEAPFGFTIDPYQFAPGSHSLGLDVLNQGGVTTHIEALFSVAALPPVIRVGGLEDAQVISNSATVTVDTLTSQSPTANITISVNGGEIANVNGQASASATINAADLQPGTATVAVTVVDGGGQSTSQTVEVEIAALPPQVTLSGIQAGETLDANRTVSVDVTSQTSVSAVTYTVDGQEIGSQDSAPFSVELDVLALVPGSHILSVKADNAGGQSATVDTAFIISEAPSLTATASAQPTATDTPKPSSTPRPSDTAAPTAATSPTEVSASVNTPESAATSEQAETPVALAASNTPQTVKPSDTPQPTVNQAATQTSEAEVVDMMTQQAISAAAAQATLSAQNTTEAQETADSQAQAATANAQETLNAVASENAQATTAAQNAEATANAQGTSDAQLTEQAQATANTQATSDAAPTAEATQEATAGATQVAADSTATDTAQVAVTPTGAAIVVTGQGTTEPTFTPIPIVAETQTAASNNNILPIAVICIVGLLVLLVIFLFTGRRRRSENR